MLMGSQPAKAASQQGFMLLESLLALLIFSLGILGMVAINARAIQAATDAEFRTDAAKFADEIATQISLNVVRSPASLATSLASFAHQPQGTNCRDNDPDKFAGAQSTNTVVTNWLGRLSAAGTGLPGAVATRQQIRVETAQFNRVVVTLCWEVPNAGLRQHTLISYIN